MCGGYSIIKTFTTITRKSDRASVAQCKVSAYAHSCRCCVATYWKEQTRRLQNCKYLPELCEKKFFFGFQNLDALYRPIAGKPTAETIFEIIKCMSDVDMHGRVRMGNTLIKPHYASVRQSRDSLHRDTHNVTQKMSRRRRALKLLELRSSKNSRRRVFGTLLCL